MDWGKKHIVIKVGTRNAIKVSAVEETLAKHYMRAPYSLGTIKVIGIDVPSDVSDQPMTMEETTRGAINRAINAFKNCDYGIGIESGLMQAPYVRSGYINFTVVAIYNGKTHSIGHSTGFEVPPKLLPALNSGDVIDKAVFDLSITDVDNIGKRGGFLGILTQGRVSRKDYTKQALMMAMIPLENKDLYSI